MQFDEFSVKSKEFKLQYSIPLFHEFFRQIRYKSSYVLYMYIASERPKRPKSVSAETEISAKLTENSAEISAETGT